MSKRNLNEVRDSFFYEWINCLVNQCRKTKWKLVYQKIHRKSAL